VTVVIVIALVAIIVAVTWFDVSLSDGVGELRVIVPRRGSVAVDARAKTGSLSVLGDHDDGRNAGARATNGGNLVLDARVGAGSVDVEPGG
jgi:hypothetical protein